MTRRFRFGICTDQAMDWEKTVERWQLSESLGFESAWLIIARYADTWNAFGSPKEMRERNQMLDSYCHEIGRDPDTLDRSLYFWVPTAESDPWFPSRPSTT